MPQIYIWGDFLYRNNEWNSMLYRTNGHRRVKDSPEEDSKKDAMGLKNLPETREIVQSTFLAYGRPGFDSLHMITWA